MSLGYPETDSSALLLEAVDVLERRYLATVEGLNEMTPPANSSFDWGIYGPYSSVLAEILD
jgi:hypothetical protein